VSLTGVASGRAARGGSQWQTWRAYVVAGEARAALIAAVGAAVDAAEGGHGEEAQCEPESLVEPYLSRGRAVAS